MSSHQRPTVLTQQTVELEKVCQWIIDLANPCPWTREIALGELSKLRHVVPDLGRLLWHSFGTMATLLLEVTSVYLAVSTATLTAPQSHRACNVLALLQCVASHPETRGEFMNAHIHAYLLPFVNTMSNTLPIQNVRLCTLGVIAELVKTDEEEAMTLLLSTEIVPPCLRIMESDSKVSKTFATFVLQNILNNNSGLSYICETYERFSQVAMTLGKMVLSLASSPSAKLLKHVVRCYLRLSDNIQGRQALRVCLPDQLRDGTFAACLREDKSIKHWLTQLLKNLETGPEVVPAGVVIVGVVPVVSPLVPQ